MQKRRRVIGVLGAFAIAGGLVTVATAGEARRGAAPATMVRVGADQPFVPAEVLVRFRTQPTKSDLRATMVDVEALESKPLALPNLYKLNLGGKTTVAEAVAELNARDDVV